MIAEVVKEIARRCVEEQVDAGIAYGVVIREEPVAVQVEERLVLDEGMMVIPEELKKREAVIGAGEDAQVLTIVPGIRKGDRVVLFHLGGSWMLAGTIR